MRDSHEFPLCFFFHRSEREYYLTEGVFHRNPGEVVPAALQPNGSGAGGAAGGGGGGGAVAGGGGGDRAAATRPRGRVRAGAGRADGGDGGAAPHAGADPAVGGLRRRCGVGGPAWGRLATRWMHLDDVCDVRRCSMQMLVCNASNALCERICIGSVEAHIVRHSLTAFVYFTKCKWGVFSHGSPCNCLLFSCGTASSEALQQKEAELQALQSQLRAFLMGTVTPGQPSHPHRGISCVRMAEQLVCVVHVCEHFYVAFTCVFVNVRSNVSLPFNCFCAWQMVQADQSRHLPKPRLSAKIMQKIFIAQLVIFLCDERDP